METRIIREQGVLAELEVHTFGCGKPHVFFTAGVHGNEVTGIFVARRLIDFFTKNPPLRGTVSVIPTVNTTAMRCMQRRNPFDGLDLNRVFPGDPEGSFALRLADVVYRETADADILIDLHCCGQHGLPYILSIYPESDKVRQMVQRITMPIALRSEGTPGQLFTESTRNRDQAACVIELPSGAGSGAVNLPVGDQCFEALLDLLRSEGMVEGTAQGQPPRFYGPLKDIEAPCAGLWMPAVKRGEPIFAGQPVGTVDGKPVLAPEDGMAMSVIPCSYLMPGDHWVMMYLQLEA